MYVCILLTVYYTQIIQMIQIIHRYKHKVRRVTERRMICKELGIPERITKQNLTKFKIK